MKIYAISGLGANEKVFEKLKIPPNFEWMYIPWLIPARDEEVSSYAFKMAHTIDDSKEFILLGLSFGGIIAQEIAKIKRPRKLILISTIKANSEKPFWIQINRVIPLYKIFPYILLNKGPLVGWFSMVRQCLNPDRPNLARLYSMRDECYTRWAFKQVVYWDSKENLECEVYHIHGTGDFIFPIWNIKNAIKIKGGGHLAVYEKAELVSKELIGILK